MPQIAITQSTSAGRYGGSLPSDIVRHFRDLAVNSDAEDSTTTTDPNVIVKLSYIPGNMALDERQILLGELLAFAQDQQSWHGDWFLWNRVNVSDLDNHQSIELVIL